MESSKKVLIDTSTLYSGLGWSGSPFKVLMKIYRGDFQLVLTDYILEELSRHFKDFEGKRRESALRSLKYLKEAAIIKKAEWMTNLERAEKEVGECKDAPIMAAFLLDDVDILVTSNTKDFPTSNYMDIMVPDEFLDK